MASSSTHTSCLRRTWQLVIIKLLFLFLWLHNSSNTSQFSLPACFHLYLLLYTVIAQTVIWTGNNSFSGSHFDAQVINLFEYLATALFGSYLSVTLLGVKPMSTQMYHEQSANYPVNIDWWWTHQAVKESTYVRCCSRAYTRKYWKFLRKREVFFFRNVSGMFLYPPSDHIWGRLLFANAEFRPRPSLCVQMLKDTAASCSSKR